MRENVSENRKRTAGRKPEEEEGRERVQSNDLLQDKQNFVRAKYERILQGVYVLYFKYRLYFLF